MRSTDALRCRSRRRTVHRIAPRTPDAPGVFDAPDESVIVVPQSPQRVLAESSAWSWRPSTGDSKSNRSTRARSSGNSTPGPRSGGSGPGGFVRASAHALRSRAAHPFPSSTRSVIRAGARRHTADTCRATSPPSPSSASPRIRLRNQLIDGLWTGRRELPPIGGESGGYREGDCWTCFRHRFSVEGETPSVSTTALNGSPVILWSRSTGTMARGRPKRVPTLLVRLSPAMTRSRMRSRSNSARAARICSWSFPAVVGAVDALAQGDENDADGL
jgi:hypothetical protein